MSVFQIELHDGPWSEDEYFALAEHHRVELLDGALLVNSHPNVRHQMLFANLLIRLSALAPAHLHVLPPMSLRLAAGRILIPDLLIVTALDWGAKGCDAADTALVLEIASPSTVAADRAIKPALYAAAGIPIYIRIEMRGPEAVVGRLVGDRYVWSEPDRVLRLDNPFAIEIDLGELSG